MTDKKKHMDDEVNETQPTAESMPVDGEQFDIHAEREALQSQLAEAESKVCLLYTSPSPRDRTRSRMPSSA